jgi:hypothetical protein
MTQTPDEPIVMPRMPPPAPATVNLDLEGLADEDLAAVRAPFRLERPLLVANTLLLAGLVTASSFGLARLDQHDDGPSFAAPRHGDAKQEGASEPGLPSEPGAPVKAVAAPAPVAPPAPAAAAAEPEPSSRTTTVHDVKTTLRVRAERRDRKTATLIVSLDEKNEGKITADVVFHRARVFVAKLAGPLDRVHDPTEHGPVPWERLTTETHVSSKAALAAFADTPGYEADAFGSADVGGAGTGALVGGASSTSELRFTLKTKGRDVAAVVSEIGLRLPDGRVERRVRSRVIPLR